MKTAAKLFIFLGLALFAKGEEYPVDSGTVSPKPLIDALEKGGLSGLNSHLVGGGKWPRITTDSYAKKNKITNQNELVALSDRFVRSLKEQADTESSAEIPAMETEAKLYFDLGEKLWKAGGYKNYVVSLLCADLAAHRCGKIVILSRGEKMGPARPEIFKVRNSDEMLDLFIAIIPECDALSNSGLDKSLTDKRVAGETWFEMIAALRKIELGETTVGKKFGENVALPFSFLGMNLSNENASALVFDYGWSQVMYDSFLPALATYLKNGGSLDALLKEPANATKFGEVMKNEVYRFSLKPVMSGKISGDQLAGFVESIQSPKKVSQRLFGTHR